VIYHSDRLSCLLAPGARGCAAGLLAELPEAAYDSAAAKNWLAHERHPSKQRTVARRNIMLVYDFTCDGGGLYKRGTGTLSITRRGTLRLRKMKTLSGLWHESSSKRFLKRIKYDQANLFDGPVLMRMREFVDFDTVGSVLSIGCGNGRFELPLLERFPITVDFIEPSPFMFELLGKNLNANKGPGKAGVLFNGLFEEFSIEKQYDCIFGIHSFYFMENGCHLCAKSSAIAQFERSPRDRATCDRWIRSKTYLRI